MLYTVGWGQKHVKPPISTKDQGAYIRLFINGQINDKLPRYVYYYILFLFHVNQTFIVVVNIKNNFYIKCSHTSISNYSAVALSMT